LFAPAVFSIVPSREIAGNLITVLLSEVDFYGLIATPFLFVTLWLGWLPLGSPLRLRSFAILLMAGATAASGFWITPQMLALRHAMTKPIETLAATDPLRREFNDLHTYSTGMMAIHMLLALLLLVYAISGATPKRKGGIEL
jgi:hypothetical protein